MDLTQRRKDAKRQAEKATDEHSIHRSEERTEMENGNSKARETNSRDDKKRRRMPELWQVVVECRDEGEQWEVYERMKAEGRRVRLHVL